MSKTTKPRELLTLQSLAIRLGIPYSKAIELRRAGKLPEDYRVKHFHLFNPDRVPSLTKLIRL
jgi:hypothetical protein